MNSVREVDDAAERVLIERCRRSDYEAFGRLVDAYQNRIFGFVKRMVPQPDDAADLTQEVFVRAFQSLNRFDGRCSIKTWLFRIAYNLCVDRSRRLGRVPAQVNLYDPDENETIDIADVRWQPDQIILDDELMAALEAAIGTMSDKLRSVLLLHDREDLSYEEIATALGLPIGTVKSRLFLARAHLQNSLSNYMKGEVQP